MSKQMPAHARDFSITIASTALGLAIEYFGDAPRLAGLAFGVALAAAGYGTHDLHRERRLEKIPFVGRFFKRAPIINTQVAQAAQSLTIR